MTESAKYIYAVVYGKGRIAYNGYDVEEVKKAANRAEESGIPYYIIRGEL